RVSRPLLVDRVGLARRADRVQPVGQREVPGQRGIEEGDPHVVVDTSWLGGVGVRRPVARWIAPQGVGSAVGAEKVAARRDDRAVWNSAANEPVEADAAETRRAAAGADRHRRAAVVVNLDELVVGAARTAEPKLADDQ